MLFHLIPQHSTTLGSQNDHFTDEENWAQEVEKVPQTQAPRINTIVGSLTVCGCWSHRGCLNGLALCGALGSSDLAGIKMQSRDWKQSCPPQPWSLTVTSRREPVACQHLPANPSRNYPIFTLKWNIEISHLSSIPQAQEFKDLPPALLLALAPPLPQVQEDFATRCYLRLSIFKSSFSPLSLPGRGNSVRMLPWVMRRMCHWKVLIPKAFWEEDKVLVLAGFVLFWRQGTKAEDSGC